MEGRIVDAVAVAELPVYRRRWLPEEGSNEWEASSTRPEETDGTENRRAVEGKRQCYELRNLHRAHVEYWWVPYQARNSDQSNHKLRSKAVRFRGPPIGPIFTMARGTQDVTGEEHLIPVPDSTVHGTLVGTVSP